MKSNLKTRRRIKRVIDLRWAAALAFAAVAVSACGSDPPERQAEPASVISRGVAFTNSEQDEQDRTDAERRAALIQQAEASDRHLQTLADGVEQRALYEHIDNEADARAEAAAQEARERQAQGSDEHLQNLADSVEDQERELQAQGSDRHLENHAADGGQ